MPLTPDELSLLGIIREGGSLSKHELVTYSCQNEITIDRHLKTLIQKRLVEADEHGSYKVLEFIDLIKEACRRTLGVEVYDAMVGCRIPLPRLVEYCAQEMFTYPARYAAPDCETIRQGMIALLEKGEL